MQLPCSMTEVPLPFSIPGGLSMWPGATCQVSLTPPAPSQRAPADAAPPAAGVSGGVQGGGLLGLARAR
jgi:hypothetical protein